MEGSRENCILGSELYKMFYKNPKEVAIQIEDILTEKGIPIKPIKR